MARLLGPDMGSRYAYLATGAPAASVTAVVYANSAGTILADIRTYDGSQTPGGTIANSQITTDTNGLLPLFWFPDGVDRVWVSVNGGTLTPIDADYNARLDNTRRVYMAAYYGALGNGVADDAAAIQAAVGAATAGGGGEVRLGKGTYLVGDTITIPVNVPIVLRGEGSEHVNGAGGTQLKRGFSFTGPVIQGIGTGDAGSQRIRVDIMDMNIDGGGLAGTVVDLQRVNTALIRNVAINNAPATLLYAFQWWNSWLDKVVFTDGGSGTTSPASVFTDDCNTVLFTDCMWEGNSGTDLRIVNSIAMSFSNPKMERGGGTYPLIDLQAAGAVQFTGGFFHLSTPATGTHIVQSGTVVPNRPNGFANCEISGNYNVGGVPGADAVVPYFVDVSAGELLLSNVSMNGSPTTAFVHAGSGVGANAVRLLNVQVTDRSKLLHDERAGSIYGFGSIPLVPAVVDAGITVEVTTQNRVIWRFPDGATNRITYANVPIPSDAADGRPVRVRVLWYAAVNTGAVRYLVGVKSLSLSNDDITVAQTDYLGTVTVPATANRTITTTVTTTVNVAPGDRWVAVLLMRVGADGADTLASDMRVLGAELLYERAV